MPEKTHSSYKAEKEAVAMVRSMRLNSQASAAQRLPVEPAFDLGSHRGDSSRPSATASPAPPATALTSTSYKDIMQLIGPTNYGAMIELFQGENGLPDGLHPEVTVSFELFEAIQSRLISTRDELDMTKKELILKNQHLAVAQQDNARLTDKVTMVQKELKQSEDMCLNLRKISTDASILAEKHETMVIGFKDEIAGLVARLNIAEKQVQDAQYRVSDALVQVAQRDAVIASLKRTQGGGGGNNGRQNSFFDTSMTGGPDDSNGTNAASGRTFRKSVNALGLPIAASSAIDRGMIEQLRSQNTQLERDKQALEVEVQDVLEMHESYRHHVERVTQQYEQQFMTYEELLAGHKCWDDFEIFMFSDDSNFERYNTEGMSTKHPSPSKRRLLEYIAKERAADPDLIVKPADKLFRVAERCHAVASNVYVPSTSMMLTDLVRVREANAYLLKGATEAAKLIQKLDTQLDTALSVGELRDVWRNVQEAWSANICCFLETGAADIEKGINGMLRKEERLRVELEESIGGYWQRLHETEYRKIVPTATKDAQASVTTENERIQCGDSYFERKDKSCTTVREAGSTPPPDGALVGYSGVDVETQTDRRGSVFFGAGQGDRGRASPRSARSQNINNNASFDSEDNDDSYDSSNLFSSFSPEDGKIVERLKQLSEQYYSFHQFFQEFSKVLRKALVSQADLCDPLAYIATLHQKQVPWEDVPELLRLDTLLVKAMLAIIVGDGDAEGRHEQYSRLAELHRLDKTVELVASSSRVNTFDQSVRRDVANYHDVRKHLLEEESLVLQQQQSHHRQSSAGRQQSLAASTQGPLAGFDDQSLKRNTNVFLQSKHTAGLFGGSNRAPSRAGGSTNNNNNRMNDISPSANSLVPGKPPRAGGSANNSSLNFSLGQPTVLSTGLTSEALHSLRGQASGDSQSNPDGENSAVLHLNDRGGGSLAVRHATGARVVSPRLNQRGTTKPKTQEIAKAEEQVDALRGMVSPQATGFGGPATLQDKIQSVMTFGRSPRQSSMDPGAAHWAGSHHQQQEQPSAASAVSQRLYVGSQSPSRSRPVSPARPPPAFIVLDKGPGEGEGPTLGGSSNNAGGPGVAGAPLFIGLSVPIPLHRPHSASNPQGATTASGGSSGASPSLPAPASGKPHLTPEQRVAQLRQGGGGSFSPMSSAATRIRLGSPARTATGEYRALDGNQFFQQTPQQQPRPGSSSLQDNQTKPQHGKQQQQQKPSGTREPSDSPDFMEDATVSPKAPLARRETLIPTQQQHNNNGNERRHDSLDVETAAAAAAAGTAAGSAREYGLSPFRTPRDPTLGAVGPTKPLSSSSNRKQHNGDVLAADNAVLALSGISATGRRPNGPNAEPASASSQKPGTPSVATNNNNSARATGASSAPPPPIPRPISKHQALKPMDVLSRVIQEQRAAALHDVQLLSQGISGTGASRAGGGGRASPSSGRTNSSQGGSGAAKPNNSNNASLQQLSNHHGSSSAAPMSWTSAATMSISSGAVVGNSAGAPAGAGGFFGVSVSGAISQSPRPTNPNQGKPRGTGLERASSPAARRAEIRQMMLMQAAQHHEELLAQAKLELTGTRGVRGEARSQTPVTNVTMQEESSLTVFESMKRHDEADLDDLLMPTQQAPPSKVSMLTGTSIHAQTVRGKKPQSANREVIDSMMRSAREGQRGGYSSGGVGGGDSLLGGITGSRYAANTSSPEDNGRRRSSSSSRKVSPEALMRAAQKRASINELMQSNNATSNNNNINTAAPLSLSDSISKTSYTPAPPSTSKPNPATATTPTPQPATTATRKSSLPLVGKPITTSLSGKRLSIQETEFLEASLSVTSPHSTARLSASGQRQ